MMIMGTHSDEVEITEGEVDDCLADVRAGKPLLAGILEALLLEQPALERVR